MTIVAVSNFVTLYTSAIVNHSTCYQISPNISGLPQAGAEAIRTINDVAKTAAPVFRFGLHHLCIQSR